MTLYDTICEIWPQYRRGSERTHREVECRFVAKYPPTLPSYKPVLGMPTEGPDPLHLWKES